MNRLALPAERGEAVGHHAAGLAAGVVADRRGRGQGGVMSPTSRNRTLLRLALTRPRQAVRLQLDLRPAARWIRFAAGLLLQRVTRGRIRAGSGCDAGFVANIGRGELAACRGSVE